MPADEHRLVPGAGVYAVTVDIDGCDRSYKGMMNIGTRPTFGVHQSTIEVNIFDFEGNLYDKFLTIGFVRRLRSEQRFDTPEELMAQMHRDAEQAKAISYKI